MTPVLTVPVVLDERAIDALAFEASAAPVGKRAVVDARHVRSVDPHGAASLLVLGHTLAQKGRRPLLQLPRNRDGVERFNALGFGRVAREVFELSAGDRRRMEGEAGSSLLKFTPICSADDASTVVDSIAVRAGPVLAESLNFSDSEVNAFGTMLRELLCGMVESAETPRAWVCVQAQRRLRRIGRPAAMVAAVDVGGQWQSTPAAALLESPALARVHEHVGHSGGRISIRSGTARMVGGGPSGETAPVLETDLAPIPGAQISILLLGRRKAVGPEA